MSKFRFERKRNSEENGIRNLAKSAGDTKRVVIIVREVFSDYTRLDNQSVVKKCE